MTGQCTDCKHPIADGQQRQCLLCALKDWRATHPNAQSNIHFSPEICRRFDELTT
jgi:hypothetical protein